MAANRNRRVSGRPPGIGDPHCSIAPRRSGHLHCPPNAARSMASPRARLKRPRQTAGCRARSTIRALPMPRDYPAASSPTTVGFPNLPSTLRTRRSRLDHGQRHSYLCAAKMNGRAAGNCTLRNICSQDARKHRASSRSPTGVARMPAAVSTTMGKNATKNAITSFDCIPSRTRRGRSEPLRLWVLIAWRSGSDTA